MTRNALVSVRITSTFRFAVDGEFVEDDLMDMEYIRDMTNGEDPDDEEVSVAINGGTFEVWEKTP